MPLYSDEDFDKGLVPSFLKQEEKELIEFAVTIGWKFHIGNRGTGATLIAPPPNEKQKVHLGRRSSIPLTRMRRQVATYGDPVKKAIIMEAAKGKIAPEIALQLVPSDVPDNTVVHDLRPDPAPVESSHDANPPQPEPEVIAGVVIPDVHIVSIKPMLAKASSGGSRSTPKAYESETTVERRWSDGTSDYGCSKCDYHSTDRISVSRHYGQAHSRKTGNVNRNPPTITAEVPDARVYAPRKTRIEALAAHLIDQLMGDKGEITVTSEDLMQVARTSLTWVHEQSTKGTPLAAEREEMTAEDTLNRIRTMLDQGTTLRYREQIGVMEQQIINMQARLDRAEQQAVRQTERADKASANLQAFKELVSELAVDSREEETEDKTDH